MFYIVLEIQYDGSAYGVLHNVYEDINAAYAKLYTILAAAAVSTIQYHAGQILRSDGVIVEGKVFDRRPAPEVGEE
ncbi:MAG: hypothetical protein IJH75_01730 [Mogibacterium sp.]|nr:hypothetical protein [Mogibacterium sp.]